MEPKYEYTHNNHFKWGFGGEWYNAPDRDKKYRIQLGHTTRPVFSFRKECVEAARLIGIAATKPILVGLSGGGDSQMVCLSLIEAKVPFRVVIVKLYDEFWNHINIEDNDVAYQFCETHNIEFIEHNINLDYFYRDDAIDYAEKYGFTNLHTIVQCSVMDHVCKNNYYIMAGGDIVMTPYMNVITPDIVQPKLKGTVVPDTVTHPVWWQTPQPIMQHMVEMGYEGTSKFFMYTPELMVSYLDHPMTQAYLQNKDVIFQTFTRWFPRPKGTWWKCFHTMYKPIMVKEQFPEVIANRKLTGFEQIETLKAPQGPRTLVGEYQKILNEAAKGKCGGQVVAPTIEQLHKYLTTPHTHALEATRVTMAP